ncbi:MAG TPA: hypothetical protein VM557_04730 [Thermoanaerobaculia bacterium]|nr:hypothetical protein [Thermoanaerobaculia bacterium]
MTLRRTLLTLILTLLPFAAFADSDIIIPITGSAIGADRSDWQGAVTIHNASNVPRSYDITFILTDGTVLTREEYLPARNTISYSNIALHLGVERGTGALIIHVHDEQAGQFAVTSRVVNHTSTGRFGQDIPAIPASDAFRTGVTGVIPGPTSVVDERFNFGIFALEPTRVMWRLLRNNGTVAAEVERSYEAHDQVQYNQGVESLLEAEPNQDDVIHARVLEGAAMFYGSSIDNQSGDPTFIPAVPVREEFLVRMLGVDLDENGTVDIEDADGDGILDAEFTVWANTFPNFFNVVVTGGEAPIQSWQIVSGPELTEMANQEGTVTSMPSSSWIGKSTTIVVRVTDGFSTSEFVLPVRVR